MTAQIIPFPSKAKPRVVPIRTGYDFEQEYREAWERAFRKSQSSDLPCDSQPPEGAA